VSTQATPRLEPVPGTPGEREPERYQSAGYRLKRALLGRPLKTSELHSERIRKRVALAVFSSDPISSTAYATEEMLLVLVLAGTAAIGLALPVSLAIVGLLAILILSYSQIIAAYSSSGGAYVVTRDNFGAGLSHVAGAALVIDYVMTVAVSVSSGTAALISAVESLAPYRVPIAVGFVLLLTWGNLRGIREAGQGLRRPDVRLRAGAGGAGVLRRLPGALRAPRAHPVRPRRGGAAGDRDQRARAGDAVPDPARLLLGYHGADRRRGDLQRRLRVP
jgi:hypothetical protein